MRLRRASGNSGKVLRIDFLQTRIDHQRRKVWLGKIAIIVRLLLGSHAVRAAFLGVVKPRFLLDALARFKRFDLPVDLILNRIADKTKGIYILDFRLGAELFLALADARSRWRRSAESPLPCCSRSRRCTG